MKKIYLSFLAVLFLFTAAKAQWVLDPNVRNVICDAILNQTQPQLCSDSHGGAIICWADFRFSPSRIYAQRIDSAGVNRWANNGIIVSDTPTTKNAVNPGIVSDGAGGAIISYEIISSPNEIYALRIDSNGAKVWPSSTGITTINNGQYPYITSDQNGGAIINWYANLPGQQEIFVQWIDKDGSIHLPAEGLRITNDLYSNYDSHVAYAGDSTAYVIYQDNGAIQIQRFDSMGNIIWGAPVTLTNTFSGLDFQYDIIANTQTDHNANVYWNDNRTASGLYGQSIDPAGTALWTAGGEPIDTIHPVIAYINLAKDGNGGDYVAYGAPVFLQRVSSTGQALFPSPVAVCNSSLGAPGIVQNDGGTGAIVAWQDSRGTRGVFAQHLDSSGTSHWAGCGATIFTGNTGGNDNFMRMISTGDSTGIAVFINSSNDIVASRVDNQVEVGVSGHLPESTVNIYPNPSHGELTVALNKDAPLPAVAHLYDLAGRLVYQQELQQQSTRLNTTFDAGVYFMTVVLNNSPVTFKIVIQ